MFRPLSRARLIRDCGSFSGATDKKRENTMKRSPTAPADVPEPIPPKLPGKFSPHSCEYPCIAVSSVKPQSLGISF